MNTNNFFYQHTYGVRREINKIKKNINNSINKNDELALIFKTFSENKLIKDLEKTNNLDIGSLLIILNPEYFNQIDNKYFIPININLLIIKADQFNTNKILSIISTLLINHSGTINYNWIQNEFMIFIKMFRDNYRYSNKQKIIIDYLINYFNLADFFKRNTLYKQLHEFTKYDKMYVKTPIHQLLNTTDSKIIDWIIKNKEKDKIILNLEKLLNFKICLIKEVDVIKILQLFVNKNNEISRNLWFNTNIPVKLLEKDYYNAFKLFEKHLIKSNYYYITSKFRNLFKNLFEKFDKNKLDVLLTNDYILYFLFEDVEFIMKNKDNFDYFISKGYRLTLGKLNDLLRYEYSNSTTKIIYNNLLKLGIPLNDKIISYFLPLIDENKIISFYSKTGDITQIIKSIILNKKYNLLDKLIKLNLISLSEYKKKLNYVIKTINFFYGNKIEQYNKQLYIYYQNQKKYSIVNPVNVIILILKTRNEKIMKKIFKYFNYTKPVISYNDVINVICENKYYLYFKGVSYINILEFLSPYIIDYNKIFDNTDAINMMVEKSLGIKLDELKLYKQYNKNYTFNFNQISENIKYYNNDDFIEILNYGLSEYHKQIDKLELQNFKDILNKLLYKFNFLPNHINIVTNWINKYPIVKDIINSKNIHSLILIYECFELNNLIFFESIGLFDFNINTNTFLLSTFFEIKPEVISYSLEKTPYLKYKTWNFIKEILKKLKDIVEDIKVQKNIRRYRIRNWGYNLVNNNTIKIYYILKNFLDKLNPQTDIIYPENNIYNSKINLDNIQFIKEDLIEQYTHFNIDFSNEKNILDEL